MRFRRLALVAVLCSLALLVIPQVGAQDQSLYWNRWDVEIDLLTNGDMRVVETHEVTFTSGQFRFGYLTIDMSRLENISDVSVAVDGYALRYSSMQTPGTFAVATDGDSFEIEYFFPNPPVEDATRLIQIAYTVSGATRYYEGGDQLYWEAVGALGWPIHSTTVTVNLPPGADMHDPVSRAECYGLPCDISISESGDHVVFQRTGRADGNTPFEVRVQFPSGVLTGTRADWQDAFDRQRSYDESVRPWLNLLFCTLGMILVIGGPAGVFVLWRTRGRDPEIGPVPEYLSEPPSELPPAIVGTLVDEKADLQDVMSTLVDLARRGYLTMEEKQEQGFFRNTTSFVFERTEKPADDLREYERIMLKGIFRGKKRCTLDSLKQKFYTSIPRIQDQLYKEVVREGFFTAEPDDVRGVWSGIGAVLLVLGLFAIFFVPGALGNVADTLVLVPVGLAVTGVVMVIAGNFMPAKTRKGAEQAALWKAFRTYLSNIRRYHADLTEVTDQFDRYLPYAVAFGLDKSWTNTFSRVPSTPIPYWYYPYGYRRVHHGGIGSAVGGAHGNLADQIARPGVGGLQGVSDRMAGSLQDMSSGLTKMLNSASSTLSSRPQSSGSSGGGGWSGGGFSGGGSSGGHGGGFG